MTIPKLKRVRVGSVQELRTWLSKQDGGSVQVMVVTHTKSVPDKYVSHEDVQGALADYGWVTGRRYTLNATLIGHVVSRSQAQ